MDKNRPEEASIILTTFLRIENNPRGIRAKKNLTTENAAKWTANPNVRGVSDQRTPGNSAQQVSPSVITVQKKEHWAKACRSQASQQLRKKQVNELTSRQETEEESSSEEDVYFLGEVVHLDTINKSGHKPWTADKKISQSLISSCNVKTIPYQQPTTDTTFANLAGARYFTKLDANSGFWQIKLSERSKPLTTFITPWGRYCLNVFPFGISSGSEKFQKCMCQILEGLYGVECNIDDVLVHGATQEEHDRRLEAVLQRLGNANVTLNAEKCVFNVSSVKFLGQIVGADGIKPDPEKIQAIREMPHPTNLHEVRSFLGMVNQFSKFTTNLADLTKPIRELLVKNTAWTWGPPQQDAFDKIKKALTSAPTLTLYDPNKATKIAADASSYGLGAVVLQEEGPDTWKPVSFISRSMTTTEARYAQIEKEALA
ncbi:Hypothetical predicted protein, partial [Paramuricea clavata]